MLTLPLAHPSATQGCASSTPAESAGGLGLPPGKQVQADPEKAAREAKAEAEAQQQKLLAADTARLAKASAKKLPKGSTWHEWGGAELEPHLAATTIVDAAWLLKLAKHEVLPERKGIVPAWQQLPDEAKLDLATLRKSTMRFFLPVAVLSYGWAAADQPDPTGALLQSLVPVLEAMVHSCEHGIGGGGNGGKPAAWGIVWDYLSLPQRGHPTGYDVDKDDRTPYELARFLAGLKSINVWYAHPRVTTLVLECASNGTCLCLAATASRARVPPPPCLPDRGPADARGRPQPGAHRQARLVHL